MKAKNIFMITTACVVVASVAINYSMNSYDDQSPPRSPASAPEKYEAMNACEKQDILWENVQKTAHKELPELRKFGAVELFKMSRQELEIKGNKRSDFSPDGWYKYLHSKGSVAKVKIVSTNDKYSGIFKGAECALLRLSLTYSPAGSKPVAPGLALKVLRDGVDSANVSALVSLQGQEKDFNFFKHPMSNIVPEGEGIGQKLVHKVFRKVSGYPEELLVNDMAAIDASGKKIKSPVAPRQIFFVPSTDLKFSESEHDVREDFATISEGSVVYQVYAAPEKYMAFDYSKFKAEDIQKFIKESQHIADIVTTSEFKASEFGDNGMFFRHQLK